MDGLLHNQFLKTMKEATTKSSKNYYLLYNNFMSLKSLKNLMLLHFFYLETLTLLYVLIAKNIFV